MLQFSFFADCIKKKYDPFSMAIHIADHIKMKLNYLMHESCFSYSITIIFLWFISLK